jgi:hypothetical protein
MGATAAVDARNAPTSVGRKRCYDVSLDGQRFYTVQAVPSPPVSLVTEINLVLNWAEELKTKVPSGQPK